jgi:hypothetical protein
VPFVPPVFAAAQALHGPGQEVLQQNPVTQLPVTHSLPPPQDWPVVFRQSGSALAAHPGGQTPSAAPHIRGVSVQTLVHLVGSPDNVRTVVWSLVQLA